MLPGEIRVRTLPVPYVAWLSATEAGQRGSGDVRASEVPRATLGFTREVMILGLDGWKVSGWVGLSDSR
jgi:hypothetical protein